MTFAELSKEYRSHADNLKHRILQLSTRLEREKNPDMRKYLQDRIRMFSDMEREASQLSVMTAKMREAV